MDYDNGYGNSFPDTTGSTDLYRSDSSSSYATTSDWSPTADYGYSQHVDPSLLISTPSPSQGYSYQQWPEQQWSEQAAQLPLEDTYYVPTQQVPNNSYSFEQYEEMPAVDPEAYTVASSSKPGKGSDERPYPCLHRECTSKPFKRHADLERHMQQTHSSTGNELYCDYEKCSRRTDPFRRKDHFREHLREFHKEDLLKRNSQDKDGKFYDSRRFTSKWWRCRTDLCRVSFHDHGITCPVCQGNLEPERQAFRTRHAQEKLQKAYAASSGTY